MCVMMGISGTEKGWSLRGQRKVLWHLSWDLKMRDWRRIDFWSTNVLHSQTQGNDGICVACQGEMRMQIPAGQGLCPQGWRGLWPSTPVSHFGHTWILRNKSLASSVKFQKWIGTSQLSVTHYNHSRVLKKMMPFKSEPLKKQPEHWNV